MNPGRDLNNLVAEQVMGHTVHRQKNVFFEATPKGNRPVRDYSNNMQDAWEVATHMGITLIPIEDGSWFAMVGPQEGWRSPQAFIECMQKGEFADSGAAVTKNAALSICIAAVKATEKKRSAPTPESTH
jgi:hypothetical protein